MSDPLFGAAISDLVLQRALAKLEHSGRLIVASTLADVVAENVEISREVLIARCTEYLDAHLRSAGRTIERGAQVGLQHTGVEEAFARTDRAHGLMAAALKNAGEPPRKLIIPDTLPSRKREDPIVQPVEVPEIRTPPEVSPLRGVPELVNGCLPYGIFVCTLEEAIAAFGVLSPKRRELGEKLRGFTGDAARTGVVEALFLAGSFVTDKREPGDIDILVALKPDFDASRTLSAFAQNVIDTRSARIRYKFDVFAGVLGSEAFEANLIYFTRDKRDASVLHLRKGLLRIDVDG